MSDHLQMLKTPLLLVNRGLHLFERRRTGLPSVGAGRHGQRLLHPKYRPDIDGLRAVAVVSVVAYHAYPNDVRGGFIGVDIFFVISGYLISTIILQNLDKGTFGFAEFYSRRIRRIFPALAAVLLAAWCVGLFVLLPGELAQLGRHIAAGAVFGSNFQLWGEAGYFDEAARAKPLLHLWSLGIEEQFYIVWPLLLWLARGRTGRLILMAALAGVSFYLNVTSIATDQVATFYSPATRFWELGCGGLLAWWSLYVPHAPAAVAGGGMAARLWGTLTRHRGVVANLVSLAGAVLLSYGFSRINVVVGFPGVWAAIPVLGAVLLIAAGPDALINRLALANPVAVWFGLISYPLYLWHWPILSFAAMTVGDMSSLMRAVPISLAVTLAWLTFMFIESPVRRGVHAARVTAVLAVVLGVAGGIGYATHLGDGFPWSWRAAGSLAGETGHEEFYQYASERYHTCTPEALAAGAPRWHGRVLCMQSQAAGVPVDVAIVGDSHAEQLFIGLAAALPSRNVVYYIEHAAPFRGGYGFDHIFEHVVGATNIKYVVLSMLWGVHFREVPAGSTEHAELLSVIDAFTRAGKTVYVTDDVPSFPFDANTCKRYRWFGRKKCEVGSDVEERRYAGEIAALSQAIAGRTDVRMVSTRKYFCDAGVCSMIRDGRLLYRDDNHVNIEGSLLVGRKIVEDNDGVFGR